MQRPKSMRWFIFNLSLVCIRALCGSSVGTSTRTQSSKNKVEMFSEIAHAMRRLAVRDNNSGSWSIGVCCRHSKRNGTGARTLSPRLARTCATGDSSALSARPRFHTPSRSDRSHRRDYAIRAEVIPIGCAKCYLRLPKQWNGATLGAWPCEC